MVYLLLKAKNITLGTNDICDVYSYQIYILQTICPTETILNVTQIYT